MLRALAMLLIYCAMLGVWLAAGLFMTIAPQRFGNLVNESFGLFPAVGAHDWGKKLLVRLLGLGLLAFGGRFLWGIGQLFQPGS